MWTAGVPCAAIAVLSRSTVAIACRDLYGGPCSVDVLDWRLGRRLHVLGGFGKIGLYANAVLPNGRLVIGGLDGRIRIGKVDDWESAQVINNGLKRSALSSVVVAADGAFVTNDSNGNIKVWRNGECEATYSGSSGDFNKGISVAIVGPRVFAVGWDKRSVVVLE